MNLCLIVTFFNLLTVTQSLSDYSIDLALDYFVYKDVKIVCLLTCSHGQSSYRFAKLASAKHMRTVSANISEKRNVTFCLHQRYTAVGVLGDIKCPSMNYLLEQASQEMWFDAMHKWLLIEEDVQLTNSTNNEISNEEYNIFRRNKTENQTNIPWNSVYALAKLNLGVDTEISLAVKEDNKNYSLYDAFNFGKIQGGVLNVTYIGFWSTKGIHILVKGYKYSQRWNFHEITLKMIAVMATQPIKFYPEMLIDPGFTPGVAALTKVGSIVLEIIRDMHNIRYNYTITDRWIGSALKNSTRVVSNSLQFKEQDITPSVRIFSHLVGTVDILHPRLFSIETRFFYRIPTRGVGKYENEFFRPLSPGSWLCAAAAMALCGLMVLLVARLARRTSPLQFAGFTILASVCQQSFEDGEGYAVKEFLSGHKLAAFVTGISCSLLYNYYTSSVVSWLLNAPTPTINSIPELIQSPLELIFEDMGYTRSWLQNPEYYFNPKNDHLEDELRKRKVHTKNRKKPLMVPLKEGIELVRAGGYAYHTEPYNANQYISKLFTHREICELGSLQMIEKTSVHVYLQHMSPFREFFLWSLMRVKERGHVSRVKYLVARPIPSCDAQSPRSLALGGAAPAFLILALGYLLALLVLIVERVQHRSCHPRNCGRTSSIAYLN